MEVLELLVDAFIVFLSVTIGWTFWKIYQRRANGRVFVMSLLFSITAIYMAIDLIGAGLLEISRLQWMESQLTILFLWASNLVSIVYVVLSGPAWSGRLKRPQ